MKQLPVVVSAMVCRNARIAPNGCLIIEDPLFVMELPTNSKFPYREEELYVVFFLQDGIGDFRIGLEMGRFESGAEFGTENFRVIGSQSDPVVASFSSRNRLFPRARVHKYKKAPFAREGFYGFRLVSLRDSNDGADVLAGPMARLTMLERGL